MVNAVGKVHRHVKMKLPFTKPRHLLVVLLWFFFLFSAIMSSSFPNILATSQPSTTFSDIINNSNLVNNISNNTGDSVYSQVASSGHNIYVVWEDNAFSRDAHNYDILFAKSAARAQAVNKQIDDKVFESKERVIVNLSNNTGASQHPQIATTDNNIYVVWEDNTYSNKEILFTKSTDGGNSFGHVVNLSNTLGDSYNEEISAFGDNVYVVWQEHDDLGVKTSIFFKASSDGGATFGDSVKLSDNAVVSSYPKVAAGGNNVAYVVWNVEQEDAQNNNDSNTTRYDGGGGGRTGGILFTKSINSGDSFSEIRKLNALEKFGEPQIIASQKDVYIVWSEIEPSHPSSLLFSGRNVATNANENNNDPKGSIFFVKSSDNANTFTNPILIAENVINPSNVEISEAANSLYVAWQGKAPDGNSQKLNDEEIFFKTSPNKGDNFEGSATINLSHNLGVSECPSIALFGHNAYVAWEDYSLGNHEIFFTKRMA
jgi:hypothetical protein